MVGSQWRHKTPGSLDGTAQVSSFEPSSSSGKNQSYSYRILPKRLPIWSYMKSDENHLKEDFSQFHFFQRWKCTHGILEAGLESASRALLVGLWNFSCISGTVEPSLSLGLLRSGAMAGEFLVDLYGEMLYWLMVKTYLLRSEAFPSLLTSHSFLNINKPWEKWAFFWVEIVYRQARVLVAESIRSEKNLH